MIMLFLVLGALVFWGFWLATRDILASLGVRCCPLGIHGGDIQIDGCTMYKVCPRCKKTIIIDTGGGAI